MSDFHSVIWTRFVRKGRKPPKNWSKSQKTEKRNRPLFPKKSKKRKKGTVPFFRNSKNRTKRTVPFVRKFYICLHFYFGYKKRVRRLHRAATTCYPCFGQDLGDWQGAGRVGLTRLQRYYFFRYWQIFSEN